MPLTSSCSWNWRAEVFSFIDFCCVLFFFVFVRLLSIKTNSKLFSPSFQFYSHCVNERPTTFSSIILSSNQWKNRNKTVRWHHFHSIKFFFVAFYITERRQFAESWKLLLQISLKIKNYAIEHRKSPIFLTTMHQSLIEMIFLLKKSSCFFKDTQLCGFFILFFSIHVPLCISNKLGIFIEEKNEHQK